MGVRPQKKLLVSQDSLFKGPAYSRTYANQPTLDSAPGQQLEGHQSHLGSGGRDWKQGESQESGIIPSLNSLPHTVPQSGEGGCPTLGDTLRPHPLQGNRCTKTESKQLHLIETNTEAAKLRRQGNMTQMKE